VRVFLTRQLSAGHYKAISKIQYLIFSYLSAFKRQFDAKNDLFEPFPGNSAAKWVKNIS